MARYKYLLRTKNKKFGVGYKKGSLFAFGIVGIWEEDFKEIDLTFWKVDIFWQIKGKEPTNGSK